MEWSHVAFGSSKTLLKEKQHRLEELCSLNNFEFLDEIKEVNADINNILHQHEIFWRKWSHSIWLLVGDKNTKFFNQRASQCWCKNHISGVFDNEGVWGHHWGEYCPYSWILFSTPIHFSKPGKCKCGAGLSGQISHSQNEWHPTPKVHIRGGQTRIISNAPILITKTHPFFLPKILAHSRDRCYSSYFISLEFRSHAKKNELYSYCINPKEKWPKAHGWI